MMICFNSWYVGGRGWEDSVSEKACVSDSRVAIANLFTLHNLASNTADCWALAVACGAPLKWNLLLPEEQARAPHFSLPLSNAHFLPWWCCCILFTPSVGAVRQVIRMAHYRPKQRHKVTGVPTYLSAHHHSCAAHISSHQSTQNKPNVELVHCLTYLDDRNH